MNDSLLLEGLTALGLSARGNLHADLITYCHEIELWNERLGLVALKHPDELVVKHVLDSLSPWVFLSGLKFASLADLGSGAGLPGIPLILTFPECRSVLVERMAKRATFLGGALRTLNRGDVQVLQRTFEEVKDQFDLITFRAFTPLEPKIVKKMRKILAPGGHIAAYKGRREVIDAELAVLGPWAEGAEVIPLTVPFLDEERHLVVLKG